MKPEKKESLKKKKFDRIQNIKRTARPYIKQFIGSLRQSDLVDVYLEKTKEYKVAKIIEKNKKGFWVLMDGFGTVPNESNVFNLIYADNVIKFFSYISFKNGD